MIYENRDMFATPEKNAGIHKGEAGDVQNFQTASTQSSPCLNNQEAISPAVRPVTVKSTIPYVHRTSTTACGQSVKSWFSLATCLAISAAITYGCDSNAAMAREEQQSTSMHGAQPPFEPMVQKEQQQQATQYLQIIAAVPAGQSACDYLKNNNLEENSQKQQEQHQNIINESNVNQTQQSQPQIVGLSNFEKFSQFLQFYRDAHREQILSPEQGIIAKSVESRLRDVFALMAMFILFERAMQYGAPNMMKRLADSSQSKNDEISDRSKQKNTSAEEQAVIADLKHQVSKLQKENESLRHKVLQESQLQQDESSTADFSLDQILQDGSLQEQLAKIKVQYQTDLENWCEARETLENKYQKLKQISKFKKERADKLQQRLEQAEEVHQQEVNELKEQLVQMTQSLALIVKSSQRRKSLPLDFNDEDEY